MASVCFVCLGNICRSPTAEGVMRSLLRERGDENRITIDSAGTGGQHAGESADPRSQAAAQRRGYQLDSRARKFVVEDFDRFDYILAMDASNLRNLQGLARSEADLAKLSLFRSFDPESPEGAEVPDPYYGGESGFDKVLDICEASCRGLLAAIDSADD